MNTSGVKSSSILGVRVDRCVSMGAVMTSVKEMICDEKCHYICTVNPEFILQAHTTSSFKNVLNNSSLNTPDGIGILYANNFIRRVKKHKNMFSRIVIGLLTPFKVNVEEGIRITGVDLFYSLCDFAQESHLNVFLLGGRKKDTLGKYVSDGVDIASLSAEKIKIKYPNLNIIGATSAYSPHPSDDAATLDYIHKAMTQAGVTKIDFFFVAYGVVRQEEWIVRNMQKIPAKLSMGVGGTFDFVSEYLPRSPNIFIRLKIEWLFRLLVQPWRIRRIYHSVIKFPLVVYKNTLDKQ